MKYSKKELAFLIKHSSKDETRLHLNCVHFDNSRGVAVATDGHRLAIKFEKPWEDEPKGLAPVNVPRAEVEAIAKGMNVYQRATFTVDGVTVYQGDDADCPIDYKRAVRVADVSFPPYRQVLPTAFPDKTGVVGVQAAYLKDAAMVAALAGRDGLGVEIVTSGELDPITICSASVVASFAVVIMPMRIGGKDQKQSRFHDMMAEIAAGDPPKEEKETEAA